MCGIQCGTDLQTFLPITKVNRILCHRVFSCKHTFYEDMRIFRWLNVLIASLRLTIIL